MPPKLKLLACEFRFSNELHTPFNTAWLTSISYAYPESELFFAAAASYHQHVRNVAQKHKIEACWTDIALSLPADNELVRNSQKDFQISRQLLQIIQQVNPDAIFLNSITPYTLLFLKAYLHLRLIRVPLYAVIHGELSTHAKRPNDSKSVWSRAFHWLSHHNLKFILLSQVIKDELSKVDYKLASNAIAVEHPYLWDLTEIPVAPPTFPVAIAHLGVVNVFKSIHLYLELIKKLEATENISFQAIGSIVPQWSEINDQQYAEVISLGASNAPVSTQEYARRIQEIAYTIGFGNRRYRFSTSASFLDALSFVKPGFYLKNEYVSHFFDKMGDVGYLCNSVDEMVERLKALDQDSILDRYQQQQKNILAGRNIFSPQAVASQLRSQIEIHKK